MSLQPSSSGLGPRRVPSSQSLNPSAYTSHYANKSPRSPISPNSHSPLSPTSPPMNVVPGNFSTMPRMQPRKASGYSTTVAGSSFGGQSRVNSARYTRGSMVPSPGSPARRPGRPGEVSEGDWGHMDPDEVFRKLSVVEVKKVESLLRNEAESKQGELRSMVSERYRDLLLSTTQISTLHSSSLRLSRTLKSIEAACARPVTTDSAVSTAPGTDAAGTSSAASTSAPAGLGLGKIGDGEGKKEKEQREMHEREMMVDQFRKPGAGVGLGRPGAGMQRTPSGLDEDLEARLPVAAKVKLLLDAPETVYTLLASQSFLEAAFLWSLARTVKEDLLASGSNPNSPASDVSASAQAFVPLVQSQWDTLLPFRNQIIFQATDSLRKERKAKGDVTTVEKANLAQTLIAVMLLDSNTLSEVADIFLSQRTLLLKDLDARVSDSKSIVKFAVTEPAGKLAMGSPGDRSRPKLSKHSRQASRLNAAEVLRELSPGPGKRRNSVSTRDAKGFAPSRHNTQGRKRAQTAQTVRAFTAFLASLMDTLVLARAVFGSAAMGEESYTRQESVIQALIKRIQEGDQKSPRPRHGSYSSESSRRLSRLPSVAGMAEILAPGPGGPGSLEGLTAGSLIRKLPASPVLLRFLPPTVRHFTPFLGSSSKLGDENLSSAVDSRLKEWLDDALQLLKNRSAIWLSKIENIRDVQVLREKLASVLEDMERLAYRPSADELAAVRKTIQDCCATRIEGIWQSKMDNMLYGAEDGLKSAIRSLASDKDLAAFEFHPTHLYFDDAIEFPPVLSNLSKSNHHPTFGATHLPAFKGVLHQRIWKRTPLMNGILSDLETEATALRADFQTIRDTELGTQLSDKYRMAAEDMHERLMETFSSTFSSIGKEVSQNEVELKMLLARVALQVEKGTPFYRSLVMSDAVQLEEAQNHILLAALKEWQAREVERAAEDFRAELGKAQALATQLGQDESLAWAARSTLVKVAQSVSDLGLPPQYDEQARNSTAMAVASKLLETLGPSSDSVTEASRAILEALNGDPERTPPTVDGLRKAQVLLNPLLSACARGGDQAQASLVSKLATESKGTRNAVLLPLGASRVGHEYVSPVTLAKPSARFGMISLA